MTPIEPYLAEVGAALRVRGAARRRFLRECRDHLTDAAAEVGEQAAVRAFGPAAEIARAFDAEVAAHRGVRSTLATVAGVLAVGGSTLALIPSASPAGHAPVFWAIAFFVAAQLAGVTAALALLQALVLRRSAMPPADVLLLARRNAFALVSAAVTMLAAGGAAAGQGSTVLLLAGPALACAAAVSVIRARSLAWRLQGATAPAVRPPLTDAMRLGGLRLPPVDARLLLLATTCAAAAAAFVRDRSEHATIGQACATGAIEAIAVVTCYLVLGPALGLWRRTANAAA